MVPLEPRQLRLVQRLDGLIEGAGGHPTRPVNAAQLPGSPSILPSGLGSGVSSHPRPIESTVPTTRRKVSTLEMPQVHAEDEVRDTPIAAHPEDALADDGISTAIEPPRFIEPGPADLEAASPVAFPEGESAAGEPGASSFLSGPPAAVFAEDDEAAAGDADAVEVGASDEFSSAEVTAEESYAEAAGAYADQLAADESPAQKDAGPPAESALKRKQLASRTRRPRAAVPALPSPPRTEPKPILDDDALVHGDSPRPRHGEPRAALRLLEREAARLRARRRPERARGRSARCRRAGLRAARDARHVLRVRSQFSAARVRVHGDGRGRDAWGPSGPSARARSRRALDQPSCWPSRGTHTCCSQLTISI
jgi:hypothetical protein